MLGAHFAGLNQVRKEFQIGGGYVRRHLGDVPAAAQRNADQLRHTGEPDDGGLAALGKSASEIAHRYVPDGVEDEVVALPASEEVCRGVVDDVISAERTDQVDVPGAGHPGHLRTVRFGDLDRKGADAAGSTIDQHRCPAWISP